jgi:hypothetical protein
MNFGSITRRIYGASHQLSRLLAFNNGHRYLTSIFDKIKLPHCISHFFFRLNLTGIKSISTTQASFNVNEDVNKKLMEFFDDKKNWNENEVKHGRNWLVPELRIKSNEDL